MTDSTERKSMKELLVEHESLLKKLNDDSFEGRMRIADIQLDLMEVFVRLGKLEEGFKKFLAGENKTSEIEEIAMEPLAMINIYWLREAIEGMLYMSTEMHLEKELYNQAIEDVLDLIDNEVEAIRDED